MADYSTTVAPSGAAYTTVMAALAAGRLVATTPGDTLLITCTGAIAGENVEISWYNSIPDGVHVLITCDSANYCRGFYDAAKASVAQIHVYSTGNAASLAFRGLPVKRTSGGEANAVYLTSLCTLADCVVENYEGPPVRVEAGSDEIRLENVATNNDILIQAGDDFLADHCVARKFRRFGGTPSAVNCIATFLNPPGWEPAFEGTWGGSHNLSDDTSAPGTGSVHNAEPLFQSGTYLLDSADTTGAIGGGTPTLTTDALGATYLDPPSMGVNEAGASGPDPAEGSAAITLDGSTASSAGSASVSGSASSALAGSTASASGSASVVGSAATTLTGSTAAGSGSPSALGTGAAALAGSTASGAASATVGASAAAALGDTTANGTGSPAVSGAAGATLAGSIVSSTGGAVEYEPAEGSAAITLDGTSAATTGTSSVSGAASVALAGTTVAASDVAPPTGPPTVRGTWAPTARTLVTASWATSHRSIITAATWSSAQALDEAA